MQMKSLKVFTPKMASAQKECKERFPTSLLYIRPMSALIVAGGVQHYSLGKKSNGAVRVS